MRLRRPTMEGIYIVTEAIAWSMAIALVATGLERSFLDEVALRLRFALVANEFTDIARAEAIVQQLSNAAGAEAGPSILIVLLAAGGGFGLMRLVQRFDLGTSLGSVVLVASTLLGVNILMHLSIGNYIFWDAGPLIGFVTDPQNNAPATLDLRQFVASPNIEGPHGPALAATFVGLMLVWFRFMLAARRSIGLDRMARSFTISFLAVLVVLILGRIVDIDTAARYAVPQFMLGMLGLAIANHERAVPAPEAARRATPWMTSVGGTLALLIGSAVILAILAYLNIGAVLSAIGDVLIQIISVVLLIIITPIYWVMEWVVSALLGDVTLDQLRENLGEAAPIEADEREEGDGVTIPAFIINSLKFFAVLGVVYLMYVVGRRIIGRRETPDDAVDEVRSSGSGGAGIGRLLADLITFRRSPNPDAWMSRHFAYRLYGRALSDAEDRGLARLPAETPVEFAGAAEHHLGGPFDRVTEIFDRVRYGRHFPSPEELREAGRDLEQWEDANPATPEMRDRIRGARQPDEADDIALRIAVAKRNARNRGDERLTGR